MRKLILFLFLLISFLTMPQSYIGENYNNFFEKMLNKQVKERIYGPETIHYGNNIYLIKLAWKNDINQITVLSYVFEKDTCVYIHQFIPISDDSIRKGIIEELENKNNDNYEQQYDYWIEIKNGFKVKITLKEQTIKEKIGVSLILEKL